MPRDSGGTHNLVPGYLAVTGQPIEASQHNPVLEDISASLTGSLPRNGSAPMGANLPMAGFKITGMADGSAATDAVTKGQLDAVASVESSINGAAVKTAIVDDDRFALTDSGASYAVRRTTLAAIKEVLTSVFALRNITVTGGGLATGGGALTGNQTVTVTAATQAEAEAGTSSTVAMTPQRTAQAIAALGGSSITDTFTANGTWTKRTGAVLVLIQVWGGGGGGGLATGGGGGGYAEALVRASDLAATQSVTVGVTTFGDGNSSSTSGVQATGGTAPPSPGVGGTGGTGNTPIRESGGVGTASNGAGGNAFYAGGGGGSSAGLSTYGGARGSAPGGGGNPGPGAGARGEVRMTTFF